MRVILTDKTEINVSQDEAEQIESSLLKSTDGFIKIGDQLIKKSQIGRVTTGGISEADIPNFDSLAIESSRCKASYSIQKEINSIAKNEGEGWAKLTRDNSWREKVRLKLWEQSDQWCDYKKDACACN